MKILFVGDYSGFHATLAGELRRLGHQCTVVGDGSRCMDTERDIDLSRRPGLFGSFGYLGRVFALWPKLRDYDVVQLINPNFLHLRTGKIRYFFRELRANNPLIGLSLAGSDPVSVKACVEDGLFRYSEFKVGDERTEYVRSTPGIIYKWINGQMGDHCRFIYENVDCAVSALYEYHAASARYLGDTPLTYAGIPVDTNAIRFREYHPAADGKLNLMVGIKSEMELFKGTDRLLAAAREVERRHPDRCRVTVARDLPFSKYMMKLEEADVVLDQLYSYTPATNALQAMAMGKIAVSGGEPEFYDFIGEKELRPVVNVVPDDEAIVRTLEELVLSRPEELIARSRMGREFVERHNAARIVAARFLTAWQKGSQVKLQVQICVFGTDGMERLLKASHPQLPEVTWLVSWQLPEGNQPVPAALLVRSDFEVIISADRGLSVNRNHALAHPCMAPLVLIGDDDVDYCEEGLLQLIREFESQPQTDIICCRYTCRGQFVKPYGTGYYSLRKAPFGWYVTSFELAFRRRAAEGLRFNELLGIGAPCLIAGEETVFLEAMLRRGSKGLLAPVTIGAHDNTTTGERMAGDPRFLFTHGAVMTYLHPRTWPLRLLVHARRSAVPSWQYLRHTFAGARYAGKMNIFDQGSRDLQDF